METKVVTCDRCGVASDDRLRLHVSDYHDGDIDLCSKCYADFRKWVDE
jgi:hypothetical protein